ncbi:hypothetical protein D5S17_30070 [Pseudonocardiaceae bacterium YIM PH 21723]|nr:hypothetical protein D5S17_30070 [Pseudonocardiaceae bacterium YIM PH 21723]
MKLPRFVIRWLKRLARYTLFTLFLFAVVWYFFVEDSGSDQQGSGSRPAPSLAQTPDRAVKDLYTFVADGRADSVCSGFTADAAKAFAGDLGVADCKDVTKQLTPKITDAQSYSEVKIPATAIVESAGKAEISSCAMTVKGGPRLGKLLLTKQQDGGWIISGHTAEPADCQGA